MHSNMKISHILELSKSEIMYTQPIKTLQNTSM